MCEPVLILKNSLDLVAADLTDVRSQFGKSSMEIQSMFSGDVIRPVWPIFLQPGAASDIHDTGHRRSGLGGVEVMILEA
jgi:hypothetical protein